MAFEEIPPVNEKEPSTFKWAHAVTALIFVIIVGVSLFYHSISDTLTSWKTARDQSGVVELPPLLVANPVTTPSPVSTTAPIYVAPSTRPGVTPIPGPLPHTGPADDITFALVGISGLAGAYAASLRHARSRLKRSLRTLHII
jgi:LPXTG-motif cell wall-anchored protein